MRKTRVSAVMTTDPITVSPDADSTTLAEALLSHEISAVPVVSASGALLGVVSEADLVRRHEHVAEHEGQPGPFARKRARDRWRRAWATRALDLMTTPVLSVDAEDSLASTAREFGRSGVRTLFVLRDGKLVGVLSRGDLLKRYARADEEIREDVLHEVFERALRMDAACVDVTVDGGVVTLSGQLDRRGEGERAARLCVHVLGVVRVVNSLTYRGGTDHDLALS